MTAEDLDKLAKFTEKTMEYLKSVEVKQNLFGMSEIIFAVPNAGEKTVQKFMVAAPINIACLVAEVRRLNDFIDEVLETSKRNEELQFDIRGERLNPVKKMLQEFVDLQKSVVTTESVDRLMGNEDAKA